VGAPIQRRVLIVDDNQDSAVSLGKMLEMLGYETCTACDGAAALEAASGFRPDVAILDIGMPEMNGYELGRRIREQAWGKGTLLIALTGWGQAADKQRTTEAGFGHHLVKPVQFDVLTRLLASVPSSRDGMSPGQA